MPNSPNADCHAQIIENNAFQTLTGIYSGAVGLERIFRRCLKTIAEYW
jgi:hypothetical protein